MEMEVNIPAILEFRIFAVLSCCPIYVWVDQDAFLNQWLEVFLEIVYYCTSLKLTLMTVRLLQKVNISRNLLKSSYFIKIFPQNKKIKLATSHVLVHDMKVFSHVFIFYIFHLFHTLSSHLMSSFNRETEWALCSCEDVGWLGEGGEVRFLFYLSFW